MTQTSPARTTPKPPQEQRRYYRIERQFSTQRHLKEVVRDLMRAHSGA